MKGGAIGFFADLLKAPERLSTLERRMRRMEIRMTAVDDVLQEINEATNDIAGDLERLRTEVQGSDAALAARLAPLAERLRAMAVDPENPVPDPPVEPPTA